MPSSLGLMQKRREDMPKKKNKTTVAFIPFLHGGKIISFKHFYYKNNLNNILNINDMACLSFNLMRRIFTNVFLLVFDSASIPPVERCCNVISHGNREQTFLLHGILKTKTIGKPKQSFSRYKQVLTMQLACYMCYMVITYVTRINPYVTLILALKLL